MYGIEFRKADNSMFVASATFEARFKDCEKRYEVVFGPDGISLWSWGELVGRNLSDSDFEKLLPQGDFGLKWTMRDFMFALTFFSEGHRAGYMEAEFHERKKNFKALGES